MIYAKGMRASQPQCQILNVGICVVVCVCVYIKYETWGIARHALHSSSSSTIVIEWNGLGIVENAIVWNIWSHYLYIIFYSVALAKCIHMCSTAHITPLHTCTPSTYDTDEGNPSFCYVQANFNVCKWSSSLHYFIGAFLISM